MMRQAGRYLPEYMALRVMSDFFAVCRTPELACEVSLQPLERFKTLDAVIIFSDILVVPQAMGMECQMVKGKGPVFPEPIESPEDLTRLKLQPNVEESLGYVLDAINLTRERIAGRCPLIGFCGGPWTLMAYMIEGGGSRTFARSKGWLYRHPEASATLLDALAECLAQYLIAQARAGAQLLQVFESWGGELPQHMFRRFVLPRLASIAARVKAACPDVPMTVFGRGLGHALESLAATDFDCVGLDWQMDPAAARARIEAVVVASSDGGTAEGAAGSRSEARRPVTLQGNLDPCALYCGSKERLRVEVKRMLKAFGPHRHIANLGHGMHPTHDPEMAGAFIELVQEESKRMYAEAATQQRA
jgi:uroporphyrinogen decarboxylase